MLVASVPVKSAVVSKVNWIAGLMALLATLNELTDALQQLLPFVPPQYQHYVTLGIVLVGGLATIITRTFFTTSVTPAALDRKNLASTVRSVAPMFLVGFLLAAVMLGRLVMRARGIIAVLAIVMVSGFALSGCTTTGTGGLFDNPENDLSIAETAFSTAQVLYNTVCAVNTESPFCTAANMQTANDLANAVRNAIAKARVVLANSGSSSAQIAAAIAGAQDAIRDFTKVVNDLQAAKSKAMVAKAMRVSMLQGVEMWGAVHLLGRT